MVTGAVEHPALRKTVDKVRSLMHYPPAYGAMDNNLTGDTCPTCLGTGRIPQGGLLSLRSTDLQYTLVVIGYCHIV